jgi:hypothetical protein
MMFGITFVLAATNIPFDFSFLDDTISGPTERSTPVYSAAQHQHNENKELNQAQRTRQCFRPQMDLSSIQPENRHALPKPYINVGFPKAGSTSLHGFFECGGINSGHFLCLSDDMTGKRRRGSCGDCMDNAIRQGLPPLKTCGDYEAFTQLDVSPHPRENKKCYWPQIEALEEIHNEAPNATFILNFRNIPNWVRSVQNWVKLDKRLMACNIIGSPALPSPEGSNNNNDTSLWLEDFFCSQVERVRDFVAKHPSHALIEVDIEDPSAGEFLSQAFDIDASCWKQSNKNNKIYANTNSTTEFKTKNNTNSEKEKKEKRRKRRRRTKERKAIMLRPTH